MRRLETGSMKLNQKNSHGVPTPSGLCLAQAGLSASFHGGTPFEFFWL